MSEVNPIPTELLPGYQPTCSTCRYWDHGDTYNGIAMCRKKPPAIGQDGAGVWPATDLNDWCGEYQRLPAQNP